MTKNWRLSRRWRSRWRSLTQTAYRIPGVASEQVANQFCHGDAAQSALLCCSTPASRLVEVLSAGASLPAAVFTSKVRTFSTRHACTKPAQRVAHGSRQNAGDAPSSKPGGVLGTLLYIYYAFYCGTLHFASGWCHLCNTCLQHLKQSTPHFLRIATQHNTVTTGCLTSYMMKQTRSI